jgi:SAM-dependent methyltransferase
MTTRKDWEEQAHNWLAWARTPGHDHWYYDVNLPQFLELLPDPPAQILDIGCGEGRLGALLSEKSYDVLGLDSSPVLIKAAADHPFPVIVADASSLPIGSETVANVVAFMSLQDIDHIDTAALEVARVLRRGGHLYIALVHPINSAGNFTSKDAQANFVIEQSYLEERRRNDLIERGGLSLTFNQYHRPLQRYFDVLERAGLLVKTLREVQPSPDFIERVPSAIRWTTVPIFLHLVAVKIH